MTSTAHPRRKRIDLTKMSSIPEEDRFNEGVTKESSPQSSKFSINFEGVHHKNKTKVS